MMRKLALSAFFILFSFFLLPKVDANGISLPSFIVWEETRYVVIDSGNIENDLNDGELWDVDSNSELSYLGSLLADFDGNNKVISGLKKPLFDDISVSLTVSDLTLETSLGREFEAQDHEGTGVLSKTSSGSINNVNVIGEIDAQSHDNIGGLVGQVYGGQITDSHSDVTIVNGGDNVGGLIGSISLNPSAPLTNEVTLTDSDESPVTVDMSQNVSLTISGASSASTVYGGDNLGGLIGSISLNPSASLTNEVTLTDSIESPVTVDMSQNVSLTISGASSTSTVNGIDDGGDNVGGLIGSIDLTPDLALTNVYTDSDESPVTVDMSQNISLTISGASSTSTVNGIDNVGGLLGNVTLEDSNIEISQSSASGEVRGDDDVGGLIGDFSAFNSDFRILSSFTSNIIVDGDSSIGGLVGELTLEIGPMQAIPTSEILDSYASGAEVTGNDSIGGLIGYLEIIKGTMLIENVYADGIVNGEEVFSDDPIVGDFSDPSDSVGGLIGEIYLLDDANLSIRDSRSSGNLGGNENLGGLVGMLSLEGSQIEISGSSSQVNVTGLTQRYWEYVCSDEPECGWEVVDLLDPVDIGGLIGDIDVETSESWTEGSWTYEKNSVLRILDSSSFGAVSGWDSLGGLIGEINVENHVIEGEVAGTADVTRTFSSGLVSGGGEYVGGLIGAANNDEGDNPGLISILASYATGDVSGRDYVGGLIGIINGGSSIKNSYATGNVTATGDGIGGLVGASLTGVTIENTISFGNVRGENGVGGLIGDLNGSINNSTALGDVSGVSDIGGLAGRMALSSNSNISYSGAHGVVSGYEDSIGGLVGYMHVTNLIEHSYSTGQVSGGEDTGGLIGVAYGEITGSWAEGYVLTNGNPGEPFVGFCGIFAEHFCDMDIFEVSAEFATNYDPNPSIATLPPNENDQLEILNVGLAVDSPAFAINSCFNSGRPYLLSLKSSYSSACISIRSKYYIKSLINKPSAVKGFNLFQKDLKKYGIDVIADDDKLLPLIMEEAQVNASDSSNLITSKGNGLQIIINSNSNSPMQFSLELSTSARILIGVIDFEKYSSATLPMFKFTTSKQIKFLLVESSDLNSKEPNLNSLKGQINLNITD